MRKAIIISDSFKGTLSSQEICRIARESFAKAYLPILAFSLISYLGVFALSSMLPLQQKLTELVLILSLSVAVFALPLFMPPFCRLGCPGLYALESRIEGALGRGLEWARRRNAKREERYYLKGPGQAPLLK